MTLYVGRMAGHTVTHVRQGRSMFSARENVPATKGRSALLYMTRSVERMEEPTATVVWHRMLVLPVMEDAPARSQCSVPRSMNQSVARMGSHTAILAMQGGTISGAGGSVLAQGD